MSNRSQLALILACVMGAVAFTGFQVFRATRIRNYASDASFTERARLSEFTSNGVRVAVFLDSDSQGRPLLRATFTPIDLGFHLYSKDLDPKTSSEVPTRLELLPHPSVIAAGPLFADVAPRTERLKELGSSVDIYPDGPVTLRLPIRFVGPVRNAAARVSLSYQTCKTDSVCRQPVENLVLELKIPRSNPSSRPDGSPGPNPAAEAPKADALGFARSLHTAELAWTCPGHSA
jgi:Disulphide bond corrector protein DsbC